MSEWFKIENKSGNQELYIYEEIDGAKDLINKLDKMDKTKPLSLRISSPGGNFFDACVIANYLKNWPGTITSYLDGLAASAASFLAINADRVIAFPQSMMMIHSVSTTACGTSNDFRQLADNLDKINSQLEQAYLKKSKQSIDTVRNWLSKDTFLTAQECFNLRLVDQIIDRSIKNCSFKFKNYDYSRTRIEVVTDRINRKFGRV